MTADRQTPLAGIRILDLSMVLAGPYCTSLLAGLGAEVIKVESAMRPDQSRQSGAGTLTYDVYNHSKRNIALDLRADGAAELVKELVSKCDVVVEAFRPGVLAKLGLDYAQLRQVKPQLLMVSISGFGQTGPDAQYGAYATIFAAMGGLAFLTGYEQGIPTEWRASADLRVGTVAFATSLAAIYRLRRTGQGGHIDLAGREVISMLIGDSLLTAQSSAIPPGPMGNADRIMSPHQTFRSADPESWVALAVGSDEEWTSFCDVSGLTDLLTDARFADVFRRWKHRDALHERVGQWMRGQDAESVVEQLQERGVAASLCYRMDQLAESAHLASRSLWQELSVVPGAGSSRESITLIGPPWIIDGARGSGTPTGAVEAGADNEYVYRQLLGLTEERYASLIASGVIC